MRGRFDDLLTDGASIRRYMKVQAEATTLGANVTLANEDGVMQAYDAGGSSRNVTLPARAATNDGQIRFIYNASTAGENLVIKNSAATTLLTLASGGVALLIGSCAAEAPATREWVAVPIGGEDVTVTDALTVNGNANIGNATTDLIGFYNGTGITQRASSNQASTNCTTSASFGATQAGAVTEIQATLTALGLWKGSA